MYAPNFDAPLRLAMGIPIFLAIDQGWLRCSDKKSIALIWIETVIPITLLWTLFFRINWPTYWGVDLTTYFVDPLTFGSYCLLFSMLSVIGLSFSWNMMRTGGKLLSFSAAICGVFLALTSGSRTGWLNLPIFLLLWTTFFLKPQLGSKVTLKVILIAIFAISTLVWKESYLLSKFSLALTEISNYNWNSMNEDTSVGMRISFYRMGYYYFSLRPIVGWGDLGWMEMMNSSSLAIYASEYTRLSPRHGFHNEIITSAIRSGMWGLASALCFYLVLIFQSAQKFISGDDSSLKAISFAALIFMTHLLVAGMTTEITNLVFLGSFIGLTLAVFFGEQGQRYDDTYTQAKLLHY
jgi:O-antigen ligase